MQVGFIYIDIPLEMLYSFHKKHGLISLYSALLIVLKFLMAFIAYSVSLQRHSCIKKAQTRLPDKVGFEDNSKIICLISQQRHTIHCDPSLEPSRGDSSNEGSQCIFIWRDIGNYPLKPLLIQSTDKEIVLSVTHSLGLK